MKKLTVCVTSDTHTMHNEINFYGYSKCNCIIHAGDFTGSRRLNKQQVIDFLHWFESLDFEYKIFIAGNHDEYIENNNEEFRNLVKELAPSCIYLQDESVEIEGITFYGSPYSNEFFNWSFMEYETKLQEIWSDINDKTNVLITHGPAYMCNDKVLNSYSAEPHVGSESLRIRKKGLKDLKVHISGHIHEAYGTNQIDGIKNICGSFLNHRYEPVNKPIKFSIQKFKSGIRTKLL